ncbi:MAG: rhodanese-like domain-containing protein [Epsilonproteobacteria bacterium]|nr:rhodanese-like domain-containing protein [Campylobacterota bacterium]
MRAVLILSLLGGLLLAKDDIPVKITPKIPYVYTIDSGVKVKVQRIQDTSNRLSDDFTRTSRLCPPHCIQPTKAAPNVETVGDLEVVKFIRDKVPSKKGFLIDVRDKRWFELETIPGAINIPYYVFDSKKKSVIEKLFKILGAKKKGDGSWDFSNAKEVMLFCNGLWCGKSPKVARKLIELGYPANKIFYYRAGLQGWKLLGLTTVIHKAHEAK